MFGCTQVHFLHNTFIKCGFRSVSQSVCFEAENDDRHLKTTAQIMVQVCILNVSRFRWALPEDDASVESRQNGRDLFSVTPS